MTKNIPINAILHKELKITCIQQDMKIKEVVESLIEKYIRDLKYDKRESNQDVSKL